MNWFSSTMTFCKIIFMFPYITDSETQLRRDMVFKPEPGGHRLCLLRAAHGGLKPDVYNSKENEMETWEASRRWLDQIANAGVLFHFQSLHHQTCKESQCLPLAVPNVTRIGT